MNTFSGILDYSPYAVLIKNISRWNEENSKLKINHLEELILYKVINAEYENKKLHVLDLIYCKELGSQATIHSKIKRLVSLGYINLLISDIDNRKKIVVPTQAAINFDQQRSIILLMAANKN
jgi:DNA-binding MarR family transcriptional regulator